ncbi:hypothetical protein A2872_02340 [Candidatus Gottesmanbacteria bacterium RIFCSPHIGHO2_01_FULL_42_12]|uniref:Uncharacterized protein n=1 Tax=Candidatus Gottesmanbacteria bacterium RIFCSPHIGHO2_01_FULL_42_12 TaxID=1798377 RepID=A0A1F5Z5H3_9BACT|nr:MAG: hypothetical protein A2872_02340 [Candidatus Gottesmanbacteria bacterium RIFCSPHIGHO2_01_FULL_42_12]
MMSGKEKLYFLLNRIDDARIITPSGQPILIHPTGNLSNNYTVVELSQLFTKLEKDEKVLKVLKEAASGYMVLNLDPYRDFEDGCYHLEILPNFDDYLLKIQQEPEYQEFTGKNPASSPTKISGNALMTYEEKLNLIVKAVVEAKKATRKDQSTTLYLNATNGLDHLDREEIRNILLQLQDENALKVNPKTNRLLPIEQQPINPNYFLLDITDTFADWCVRYQVKQKGKIENLSEANFKEVYFVLTQLEDQLQLSQSDKFNFGFVTSVHDIQGYDSEDVDDLTNSYIKVLEYLKKIGVIKDYSHGAMSLDADVTLDITRYLEVMETAKKVKRSQEQIEPAIPVIPTNDKIQLAYNPNKGLLTVGNKTVKLNKDSFRAKLLELLLKDDKSRKKEWSWDEVIEAIENTKDEATTKENKGKFYPACDGLTKHIASKIGINDLLTFNKSTVQINSKYL